eukprot:3454927-Rhodomonas_salina.6
MSACSAAVAATVPGVPGGAGALLPSGVSATEACVRFGTACRSGLRRSTDCALRSAAISAGVSGSTPGTPPPPDVDGRILSPAITLPGASPPMTKRAGATCSADARSMRSCHPLLSDVVHTHTHTHTHTACRE